MADVPIWDGKLNDGKGGLVMVPEEEAQLPKLPTPAELEASVQKIADDLTQNAERDMAMAKATVDLVIAARDGLLAGLTQAQIRTEYRDRVVQYLREARGI
jgi:hypothetical protein